jgi:hypothetical protein
MIRSRAPLGGRALSSPLSPTVLLTLLFKLTKGVFLKSIRIGALHIWTEFRSELRI